MSEGGGGEHSMIYVQKLYVFVTTQDIIFTLIAQCPLLLKFVRDLCTMHRVNVQQISYTEAFMSAKEFTKAC